MIVSVRVYLMSLTKEYLYKVQSIEKGDMNHGFIHVLVHVMLLHVPYTETLEDNFLLHKDKIIIMIDGQTKRTRLPQNYSMHEISDLGSLYRNL